MEAIVGGFEHVFDKLTNNEKCEKDLSDTSSQMNLVIAENEFNFCSKFTKVC